MKLKTKLPLFTSFTVLTSIVLIAFYSISKFKANALEDIQKFKKDQIETLTKQLKDIVNIAYDMIDHSYRNSSDMGVRERYGFEITDSLDDENVKMVAINMLKITLENLRVLRFGVDGYLWINEYEPPYVVVMHASMPELEGDPHVFYVGDTDENVYDAYADCIRANNGEGILTYQFYKPETSEWISKIAFIKLYEPLGWVIGTGVYEDYIDELVLEKTVALNTRISNLVRITIIIGVILILIATIVLYYFGNSVTEPIKMIENQLNQMSQGLVVEKLALERNDEIGQMKKSLDALIEGFASYAGFAKQIGMGNLDSQFKLLSSKDNLGNSLLEMRDSLRKAQEEEERRKEENKRRQWAAEAIAVLGDIIRMGDDANGSMVSKVLKKLAEYIDAQIGGIFVLNDRDKDDIYLEQVATIAYQKAKFVQHRVYPGEGLVGQCYLEKEKINMTKLPKKYIEIHSGLGTSSPKNLLLLPLIMDEKVLGILELASTHVFEDYEIEFMERVAQSLAIAIASSRITSSVYSQEMELVN
ncbi:MAG: cache domain-containing protein [Bacteroidales bacterium]|nr:cache domain-containing protein [Bacteroidales bacterium]